MELKATPPCARRGPKTRLNAPPAPPKSTIGAAQNCAFPSFPWCRNVLADPGGITDNSPTFQRWDQWPVARQVPKGWLKFIPRRMPPTKDESLLAQFRWTKTPSLIAPRCNGPHEPSQSPERLPHSLNNSIADVKSRRLQLCYRSSERVEVSFLYSPGHDTEGAKNFEAQCFGCASSGSVVQQH